MSGTAGRGETRELRARRARVRCRDRRARHGDHGFAPARAVLRLVDDRLGEPHRHRPRCARARLLARGAGSQIDGPSRGSSGRSCSRAAVFVAVIPFAAKPFLDFTVDGLDTASLGAVVGSFLAVLLLCAPPVVLLGMVSPFAIRLAVSSIATAGAVAGRLYALSTAGSLVGTFLPALVLIPAIGTQRTFLVIAVLLAALVVLPARARATSSSPAVLAALLVVSPGAIKAEDGLIHEETSYYQYIGVVERPDGRRLLHLNEGVAVHSVWRPDSVLTGRRLGHLSRSPTAPRAASRARRDPRERGRDDRTRSRRLLPERGDRRRRARPRGQPRRPPLLRDGATTHDSPSMTRTRGRSSARRTTRYDLIVVDAYRQPYVPFYLATREFFRLVREHLEPGGIVALNVAAVPDDERLVSAVGGTLAAEFPQVLALAGAPLQHDRSGLDRAALGERAAPPPCDRAEGARADPGAPRPQRPSSRGIRAPLDGRSRSRRMAHGPDDRLVRRRGRQTRGGLPSDEALTVISLARRDGRPLRIGHRGAPSLRPRTRCPRSGPLWTPGSTSSSSTSSPDPTAISSSRTRVTRWSPTRRRSTRCCASSSTRRLRSASTSI